MSMPTDQQILDAMKGRHTLMTYYIKNCLRTEHKGITTDFVRRRLIAMEKQGLVERAPGSTSHICWSLTPQA